jgi:hypothetical protein
MVDATAGIGGWLGSIFSGFNVTLILGVIVGIAILGAAIGFGVWWYINKMKYNHVCVTFQRIGGELRPLGRHLAMPINLTRMGDKILLVKKIKKTLNWPLTFMGPNISWWEVLPNGDWQNFGIKVSAFNQNQVEQMILERDSRLIKSQTDKLMKERLDSASWWNKNKDWIIPLIFFIIAGLLMAWVLTKSMQVVPAVKEAAQALKEAAQAIANAKAINAGTGLIPA